MFISGTKKKTSEDDVHHKIDEPHQTCLAELLQTDDSNISQSGIDSQFTLAQKMSYYHEPSSYYYNSHYDHDEDLSNFNSRSMLGYLPDPNKKKTCNQDIIKEVHELIDGIEEDFLKDDDELSEPEVKDEKLPGVNYIDDEKVKYEDCYDEFHEDENEKTPEWYENMVCTLSFTPKVTVLNLINLYI